MMLTTVIANRSKKRALFAAVLVLAVAAVLPSLASATEDDRAVADRIATELQHDQAHQVLTSDAVAQTRKALERALRMHQAGDDVRAREVEGLARSWAEMGKDLVRTADAEARSRQLLNAASDAGAHAERERALLEEAIAQNSRLKAEVASAEKEESAAPTRTSAVAKKDADAGAKTPKSPKPSSLKIDGGVK